MRLNSKVVTACLVSVLLFSCFAVFSVQPVAAYTGTITYSAVTNTVTAVGGNLAVPINFNDLYLAVGNSSLIALQGTNQYLFNCKVIIGNGTTTYFADSNKQIVFNSGIVKAGSQALIATKANSLTTFGVLIDATAKTTKDGCSFISLESVYTNTIIISSDVATANVYSCSFSATALTHYGVLTGKSGASYTPCKVYNSIFHDKCSIWAEKYSVDVYNTIVSAGGTAGLVNAGSGSNVDRLTITDSAFGVQQSYYSSNVTLSNVVVKRSGTNAIRIIGSQNANLNLINPAIDVWGITWTAPYANFKIYRQYEFDLAVLNGEVTEFVEGANVTLSKGGVAVGSWLTNSSGQIGTQILTYGYYQQSTGNTLQGGADPFVLTVTHPDWADYTSRFYVTEKTKMTISMQEVSGASESEIDEWFVVGGVLGCVFAAVVVGALLLARKND